MSRSRKTELSRPVLNEPVRRWLPMGQDIVNGVLELSVQFPVPFRYVYRSDASTTWSPVADVPTAAPACEEPRDEVEALAPLQPSLIAEFGVNRKGQAVLLGRRETWVDDNRGEPELHIAYQRQTHRVRRPMILID